LGAYPGIRLGRSYHSGRPANKGMSWTEPDSIDEEATAHRGLNR
jgi:hypothetical protein